MRRELFSVAHRRGLDAAEFAQGGGIAQNRRYRDFALSYFEHMRTTSLEPLSANLWRRGFSQPLPPRTPREPERFDWEVLAERFLGSRGKWPELYEYNRERVGNDMCRCKRNAWKLARLAPLERQRLTHEAIGGDGTIGVGKVEFVVSRS